MTIPVTLEHLRYASRNNCTLCPVARALFAATGIVWEVAWQNGSMLEAQQSANRDIVVLLPQNAIDFVNRFDRTGEGEPFEFEFDYPVSGASQ